MTTTFVKKLRSTKLCIQPRLFHGNIYMDLTEINRFPTQRMRTRRGLMPTWCTKRYSHPSRTSLPIVILFSTGLLHATCPVHALNTRQSKHAPGSNTYEYLARHFWGPTLPNPLHNFPLPSHPIPSILPSTSPLLPLLPPCFSHPLYPILSSLSSFASMSHARNSARECGGAL